MNRITIKISYIIFFFVMIVFSTCKDTPLESSPDDGTVYFKVAETNPTPAHNDSFIIALTDSAHIAHARLLIDDQNASPDKIIFAKIVPQKGTEEYQNINLINNTTWSWRVETFDSFTFNTIEIFDGWPGYIEEDLERWFLNTSGESTYGYIGFWGYTVVEEVNAAQLQ